MFEDVGWRYVVEVEKKDVLVIVKDGGVTSFDDVDLLYTKSLVGELRRALDAAILSIFSLAGCRDR